MAGYLVLGAGFGILLADKGYSCWWAVIMSVTICAGTMQYIGAELLACAASPISTAIMTLMVNARYLIYGLSMLEKYKKLGPKRFYAIFALTDETYSLVCKSDCPDGVDEGWYCVLVSLMDQSYWTFGSLVGGFLGSSLSFDTAGIDFSMTALFLVILMEQLENSRNHLPAALGLVMSVGCLIVFGADYFLIPAMALIASGLLLARKRLEGGGKK